jgi:hypothetical protein
MIESTAHSTCLNCSQSSGITSSAFLTFFAARARTLYAENPELRTFARTATQSAYDAAANSPPQAGPAASYGPAGAPIRPRTGRSPYGPAGSPGSNPRYLLSVMQNSSFAISLLGFFVTLALLRNDGPDCVVEAILSTVFVQNLAEPQRTENIRCCWLTHPPLHWRKLQSCCLAWPCWIQPPRGVFHAQSCCLAWPCWIQPPRGVFHATIIQLQPTRGTIVLPRSFFS